MTQLDKRSLRHRLRFAYYPLAKLWDEAHPPAFSSWRSLLSESRKKRILIHKEKKTVYMLHVLETKLVVGDMILSDASEFIENEFEDISKQDCELKAFHQLQKNKASI